MFYSYQVNDYSILFYTKKNDNKIMLIMIKKMMNLISSAKSKYTCIYANIKHFESLLRFDYDINDLLIKTFYFRAMA